MTTGVQALFDPIEESELQQALAFTYARHHLIGALTTHVSLDTAGPFENQRRFGGLIRRVDGMRFAPSMKPWGWTAEREPGMDVYNVMPAWVSILRSCWRLATWGWWKLPLVRLGFMQGPEGGMYSEFRWDWRFWRSRYSGIGKWGRGRPRRDDVMDWFAWPLPFAFYPIWYRFGRWLGRQETEWRFDWQDRMPMWSGEGWDPVEPLSWRAQFIMMEQAAIPTWGSSLCSSGPPLTAAMVIAAAEKLKQQGPL